MMPALLSFLSDSGGLKKYIEDEGHHPAEAVEVWSGHDLAADCYRIDICCMECERRWTLNITRDFMFSMQREAVSTATGEALMREHLLRQILPFVKKVGRTLCFRFSLAAELAEWLTARVAEAGAKGVKYSALVAEAEHEHLCDERDITAMLERLGFRMDFGAGFTAVAEDLPTMVEVAHIGGKLIHDGWVTLPFDHPLRRSSRNA
jgi:hypothetical protein